MKSPARLECEQFVTKSSIIIKEQISIGKLLYVGIAGDLNKQGEYSILFPGFKNYTLDCGKLWKPNIVSDITNNCIKSESIDVVLCVQTLEHISHIFNLSNELCRILKKFGYIIIDCAWNYIYHPEPPNFGDYWRISKDGMQYLFKDNFKILEIKQDNNTSCLLQRIK